MHHCIGSRFEHQEEEQVGYEGLISFRLEVVMEIGWSSLSNLKKSKKDSSMRWCVNPHPVLLLRRQDENEI